jgi:hypothetical protein
MSKLRIYHLVNNTYQVVEEIIDESTVWFQGTVSECMDYVAKQNGVDPSTLSQLTARFDKLVDDIEELKMLVNVLEEEIKNKQ